MSRGAAFFDLDRTLLAGASGEVFSDAMRSAGLVSRSIPGERLLFRVFNAIGETLPSMALARQAVALVQGTPAGGGAGRRRVGRRPAGVDGAAVRRVGVRPPSRGGPAAGARHHHAVRPRQAVRRPDRARRRGRHPVGRQRRRHLRRHARRPVRVVVGQARRRPRVGRGERHRPRRELRLLRQRVRRSAALGGRRTRSWSTPTRGWWSSRGRGAGRCSTSTCRLV